jgi:hypothetical protein
VTVSVSPTSIHEGDSATFTVTASSPVAQDTNVTYSMSGKATLGSDYTMSAAQFTIPAGQSSATVTLSAIVDNVKEKKGETAIMTLQPGAGYDFGATTSSGTKGKQKKGAKTTKAPSATVTILD